MTSKRSRPLTPHDQPSSPPSSHTDPHSYHLPCISLALFRLKSISARVLFGAFVVAALDHRASSITSRRSKIVTLAYTGAAVPEMQRAQSSFQKSVVNSQLFKGSHLNLEINARDLEGSFTEKAIAKRLHDATAAHKPTHYSFFDAGAAELSVDDFTKDDDSDEEFE